MPFCSIPCRLLALAASWVVHGARFARIPAVGGVLRAHGSLMLGARFARRACAYRVSTSKSFLQVGSSLSISIASFQRRPPRSLARHTSHSTRLAAWRALTLSGVRRVSAALELLAAALTRCALCYEG
jgi:hypothetical protein